MLTKDVLGIYWNSRLGEVDGQTFYAFSNSLDFLAPDFPVDLWNCEYKKHKLFGDDWVVWLWDVKFNSSNENWLIKTKETLLFFIESKAIISWCGLDGCFSEPPDLFHPEKMLGGVYAAMGKDKRFVCHTDFYDEYVFLGRDDLVRLKSMM